MTLSEALDRARRERLGESVSVASVSESSPQPEHAANCERCDCLGFPELVDLVRGTVEMVCPACQHVWIADRSVIPTA